MSLHHFKTTQFHNPHQPLFFTFCFASFLVLGWTDSIKESKAKAQSGPCYPWGVDKPYVLSLSQSSTSILSTPLHSCPDIQINTLSSTTFLSWIRTAWLSSAQLFYAKHNSVAFSPLKSPTSIKLLNALIKTGKKDPKPLIHNVGSMVKVWSQNLKRSIAGNLGKGVQISKLAGGMEPRDL